MPKIGTRAPYTTVAAAFLDGRLLKSQPEAPKDKPPHSRSVARPSLCGKSASPKGEGAGNAGCFAAPAALCAKQRSTQANSPQVKPNIDIPCATVLTAAS